jgi:hypothetical protein
MGYFEARKGPFALFTDVVWEDLGFPGHARDDLNRGASGRPFPRFPNVVVSADADLVITLALTAQTISIGGIHSWASGCATRWGRPRN